MHNHHAVPVDTLVLQYKHHAIPIDTLVHQYNQHAVTVHTKSSVPGCRDYQIHFDDAVYPLATVKILIVMNYCF